MGLLKSARRTYSLNFPAVLFLHLFSICSYSCEVSLSPIMRVLNEFFFSITNHFHVFNSLHLKSYTNRPDFGGIAARSRLFNNRTSGRLLKRGNLPAFSMFLRSFKYSWCLIFLELQNLISSRGTYFNCLKSYRGF